MPGHIYRAITFLLVLFTSAALLEAQDPQTAALSVKAKSDIYYWGEGSGDTEREARDNARQSMVASNYAVVGGGGWISANRDNGEDTLNETERTYFSSGMSVRGLTFIDWEETIKIDKRTTEIRYHSLCYVSKENVEDSRKERHEKISEMIDLGIDQEKQLAIGSALKYYSWALNLIRFFNDEVKVDIEGQRKNAKTWLNAKIESVLSKITFDFNEREVTYTPDDYDKHTVRMGVFYNGNPVQTLDLKYFNGERYLETHAKNGFAVMRFVNLAEINDLNIKVEFAYAEDAAKSFDEEIKIATAARVGFANDDLALHSIPIKLKKNEISVDKKTEAKLTAAKLADLSPEAAAEKPIIGIPRSLIERPVVNNEQLVETIKKVEQSLRSCDYRSIRGLFTENGYESFRRMTDKSKITVVKKHPEYHIESTDLFCYGGSIPVAVQNGSCVSNERIVFRFDKESGLIKSTAYALTTKAENDIFRQADWDLNSRYSLLSFMEDYQTAFLTKNIEFIEKLFSDNAIIIVGKAIGSDDKKTRLYDGQYFFGTKDKQRFTFSRYTKTEYIAQLRKVFKNNSWIRVSYEENVISKVNTPQALLGNEVLWIEIRQNWDSASGYNDSGYLALQINMRPEGSQINVRTFTPEFISLDRLKSEFPVTINN